MDALNGLLYGLSVAFEFHNLGLLLAGCLLGTLVGVLPGLGPVGAISILLPLTFQLPPAGAIIMLAGIYNGAMYGGSTTSILINVPGEAASAVTCLDGYAMARKGRAGTALGIAVFGSFIAGTVGLIGLQLIGGPLSVLALKFGPPEYFAIILMGFTFIVYLAQGSMIKAVLMALAGILLSLIGLDPITSEQRFTFGNIHLFEGLSVVPLAIGLFGLAEVFVNLEKTAPARVLQVKIKNMFPNKSQWLRARWAIVRGTVIGFFMGILPGGGPVLSTFMAYGVEKRVSKHPEKFGHGAIEGVAAPESANNAAASTSFIPLMTLGIPPNVVLAVLFGAFMIHGVTPGPLLMTQHPEIFWGVIASMYMGNVILLILNLPLIPLWVQVLRIPDKILYPLIVLFCLLGAYSVHNSVFDIGVMLLFGMVGYLLNKFDFEPAPLVLGFVLGPLFEVNLRRSLLMSQGSFAIFVERPIALVALIVCVILIILPFIQAIRKTSRPIS
ncbi:MAG: Tripartite tricarboxylate transporter TctA family protein [Deltaproteobacteria bacterium ADurb.Bin151]|nr:tripartite tricarboxylate transporter permease [Smithella sp.]OQB54733.1 MAG: Tripartite tricarboxylate transporter TctA family protein [Deltaproteobacteria bacterium ADurb.Bin151]HNZ11327.1 tripartite tricarboxylate transporter permease [Smithellaceae bacterium]HOG82285.1 tripartite tricarboxylate transporter permease [Smithellaceae bacterium]HOQ41295.1 tripartite tricarboxylate transporter permease [Smithellaceae bacterium]